MLVAYVYDVHLTNYLLAYLLTYNQHITHSQLNVLVSLLNF